MAQQRDEFLADLANNFSNTISKLTKLQSELFKSAIIGDFSISNNTSRAAESSISSLSTPTPTLPLGVSQKRKRQLTAKKL